MSSPYLDMIRGQRRRTAGFQFIAIIAMVGSAVYWWGVQSQLTDNRLVVLSITVSLVLAPSSLVSCLMPWSPTGTLLQRVDWRAWGYTAVTGCILLLMYYFYTFQGGWLVGIIGFIIIPALLWTPVSSEELVQQVLQAQLIRDYDPQQQAKLVQLLATRLRAQKVTLLGMTQLIVEEREELKPVMRGLITGIDRTLHELGQGVKSVSDVIVLFEEHEDNDDTQRLLDYIGESLTSTNLTVNRELRRRTQQFPMTRSGRNMEYLNERHYNSTRSQHDEYRTKHESLHRLANRSPQARSIVAQLVKTLFSAIIR